MAENGALSSGAAEVERVPARRRFTMRRALQGALLVAAILVALPLVLVPLYAVVNPPVSTVMLWKRLGGAPIDKRWADIEDINPTLVRAVITSEDQRFCMHNGIDFVELQNALDDEDGRFRGASTITMQTAKNLFLWTGRGWVRKAVEAPLALYLDLILSKRRIMEIYLNVVEWDTGVYGAAAASEHYFNIPPAKLSSAQAARLAAILPSPETRDAANPGPGTRRIARRIAQRANFSGAYVTCVLQ
jgi:monofunctional biosynthetic peptidoglycan transglycosylase